LAQPQAIGLLRALAICDEQYLRPERKAGGNWKLANSNTLREISQLGKLTGFFEQRYQPTPIFSPWNTGSGLEKRRSAYLLPVRVMRKDRAA